MNIKEVIQYLAEHNVQINLTLQVGSDGEVEEEVRQLRRRIDELQLDGALIGSDEPDKQEASGEPYGVDPDFSSDAEDVPEESVETFESESADPVEEEDVEEMQEKDGEDTEQPDEEALEADDEFEEMFGEEEPDPVEEEEEDDEPSEEARKEAEEDFRDVFDLD